MAYRLDLPEEFSRAHNVFHISMLRKYIPDSSHVLETPEIELRDDLSYEEQPVSLVKEHRNKTVSLVKEEPPSRGSDLGARRPNAEPVSSSLP